MKTTNGTATKPMAESLEAIRKSLSSAQNALDEDVPELIDYFMERAFLQTLVLLEGWDLLLARKAVENLHKKAQRDYQQIAEMQPHETYLVWAEALEQHIVALGATFGEKEASTISVDLIEILRRTQYVITDPQCFNSLPMGEADVHRPIEAVLRAVFPGVRHKPPIAKPIKNFVPDTGLPSLRTLIEYKYVSNTEDAQRVADQVLADTRGYLSKDWDHFVYVIYESRRLKPEAEWYELMRTAGVGENTKVVVICGEPSPRLIQDKVPKSKRAKRAQAVGKRTTAPVGPGLAAARRNRAN
jgi:hypothetical protein